MDLSERAGGSRRHPWERARARFFVDRIAQAPAVGGAVRILDVGAGDAYLAEVLLARLPDAQVVCWDAAYSDDDLARLGNARLTAVRERPAGVFDVLLLLDVLEHVDDDLGLLRETLPLLRPGGVVLVSVPAWPVLFSRHDEQLRHLRRYTPATLLELLRRAGVDILGAGGLFASLVLPRLATVLWERVRPGTGVTGVGAWQGGDLVTSLVEAGLRADAGLGRRLAQVGLSLPGLSCWAIGRWGAS